MANWGKYGIAAAIAGISVAGAYYYPAEFFITFTAGNTGQTRRTGSWCRLNQAKL